MYSSIFSRATEGKTEYICASDSMLLQMGNEGTEMLMWTG